MTTITIEAVENTGLLHVLNETFNGSITDEFGEQSLVFNNKLGKGTIRCIAFDWGISLLDYDVTFHEDLKIIFKISKANRSLAATPE